MAMLQHSSTIDPATIAAYKETEFRVLGEAGFMLHRDRPSHALAAAFNACSVDCAAFVTAANPFSRQCTVEENAEALARLAAELDSRSLRYVPGLGIHPSGGWPGEDSFLVHGLALEAA